MAFVDSEWTGRFVDYVVRSGVGSVEEVLQAVRDTLEARFGAEAHGIDLAVRRARSQMERRVESSPDHPTVNDRIEAAVAATGLLWARWPVNRVEEALAQTGVQGAYKRRDVLYWKRSDVQGAIAEKGLWLRVAWSAQGDRAAVARRLAESLRQHGVRCAAYGDDAVFVSPFSWSPRRKTTLGVVDLTSEPVNDRPEVPDRARFQGWIDRFRAASEPPHGERVLRRVAMKEGGEDWDRSIYAVLFAPGTFDSLDAFDAFYAVFGMCIQAWALRWDPAEFYIADEAGGAPHPAPTPGWRPASIREFLGPVRSQVQPWGTVQDARGWDETPEEWRVLARLDTGWLLVVYLDDQLGEADLSASPPTPVMPSKKLSRKERLRREREASQRASESGAGSAGPEREAPVDLTVQLRLTRQEARRGVTREVDVGERSMRMAVPPGVQSGTKLRLRGAAPGGADVYVELVVGGWSRDHRGR